MKKLIGSLMIMSIILASCGEEAQVGLGLRECPDIHVINRMQRVLLEGQVPDPKGYSEYYIIHDDGRKEIDEFDTKWVEENCDIEVQEVW